MGKLFLLRFKFVQILHLEWFFFVQLLQSEINDRCCLSINEVLEVEFQCVLKVIIFLKNPCEVRQK